MRGPEAFVTHPAVAVLASGREWRAFNFGRDNWLLTESGLVSPLREV